MILVIIDDNEDPGIQIEKETKSDNQTNLVPDIDVNNEMRTRTLYQLE